jgi:2-phospho-L-lactate guanylyltransferase
MKYVLIPIKELTRAKQRLAGFMTQKQRSALAWLMLEHLFHEVARARGYDGVAVVTLDAAAAQLARRFHFEVIKETQQTSENASVDYGSGILGARDARSVLRLPIDLPLIAAEDIENILARVNEQPAVVLVPSRDGTGTNAIVRTPPELFPSYFGPNSLAKHLYEARRCGVPSELIHLPRVALDLDDPVDLAYVLECGSVTRVYEFLVSLRIDERLLRATVSCSVAHAK